MINKGQTGSYGVMGEHNRTHERQSRIMARLKDNKGFISGTIIGWGNSGSCHIKDVEVKTYDGMSTEESRWLDILRETDEVKIY